jgi:hypothetical protein
LFLRLIVSGNDGFALHAGQAAQLARQSIDFVHRPLDDERDDGNGTVVEWQTLPAENNTGMFGQQFVDRKRHFAVAQEYGYCSYSLLHQVLGFWIRQLVYTTKIQNKSDMAKYFFTMIPPGPL